MPSDDFSTFSRKVNRAALAASPGWLLELLPDGRVELQVSGEDEEMNAFLEAIRQSDLGSLIKRESEHVLATPPDSRGFEIRT